MVAPKLSSAARLFVALNVVLCSAAVVPRDHVVHHERRNLPSGWKQVRRIDPDTVQSVRIALAQRNLDNGGQKLLDISDPTSPNYGKHWTPEQIRHYFSPANETVDAVRQWLEESIPSSGIVTPVRLSFNKAWIEFSIATTHLEDLLSTEFYHHEHISGRSMPAAQAYHVPMHIRDHVDFIEPGILVDSPIDKRKTVSSPREKNGPKTTTSSSHLPLHLVQRDASADSPVIPCNNSLVSPACVRSLYGVPPGPPPNDTSYRHGIFVGNNDQWNQADMNLFFAQYAPEIPAGTKPITYSIDGAPDSERPDEVDGGEPLIDLAMVLPLVYPNQVVMVSEDDAVVKAGDWPGSLNTMLEAFDASYCTYSAFNVTGPQSPYDPVYPDPAEGGYKGERNCGTLKPPSVIGISWGNSENGFPISYQRRQCDEFMKLGLMGVSVIVATGNYGIGSHWDQPNNYCYGPDGEQWAVGWPANCPYVTAVGATQLTPEVDILNPGSTNPEQGLFNNQLNPGHNFSSAGGVSAIYPRPSYQEAVVSKYIETANISTPGYSGLSQGQDNETWLDDILVNQLLTTGPKGSYRALSGRAQPDISALGDAVVAYVGDGQVWGSGGTSVSAQLIAGFITRINLERLAVGKPTVGFINPVLYQHADTIVRDITEGENNAACNQEGYPVTEGWDAVTGLGVLKYEEALKLWMTL